MYKAPVSAYQKEVEAFRRQLIQSALEANDGNRTHAARALGLQRTYLLRLIRLFRISVPIAERYRRQNTNGE